MASSDDDPRLNFITRQEASEIALAAAKEGSRQTANEIWAMFGVNTGNFDSMQAFRSDLEWLRRGRRLSELTGNRIWTTIVALGAGGIAIALWEAFENLVATKH
jgi:hypothetical protein